MNRNAVVLLVAGILVWTESVGPVAGQEKEFQAKGEIKIGLHDLEMTAGEIYMVKVTGKGFVVNAMIQPGFLRQQYLPPDPSQPFKFDSSPPFEAVFIPQTTQTHRIAIFPNVFGKAPEGMLQYELSVKRIVVSKTTLFEKKDEITAADPKVDSKFVFRKGHHKSYKIALKADQTYVIEMVRKRDESKLRDPYLFLENDAKAIVAQDDDGAGNLNARIVFRAVKAGDYRIIATTLGENDVGEFTLTVRESAKE